MLTSRSRCGSIVKTMERIKIYMRGWLNYFGIADMKNNIESLNGWLYRERHSAYSWKLVATDKVPEGKQDGTSQAKSNHLFASILHQSVLKKNMHNSYASKASEKPQLLRRFFHFLVLLILSTTAPSMILIYK